METKEIKHRLLNDIDFTPTTQQVLTIIQALEVAKENLKLMKLFRSDDETANDMRWFIERHHERYNKMPEVDLWVEYHSLDYYSANIDALFSKELETFAKYELTHGTR
jgi:hypothetical protein